MNISLQALKVFESAARLGSFKAAAEELALSPTSISHHIRRLEQRLKVDLFYRRVREVELTPQGMTLSSELTKGFAQIRQAVDEIAESGNRIKINTTSSFAALVLVPALEQLNQTNPELKVDVATGEEIRPEANALSIRFGHLPQSRQDIFYLRNQQLHRDHYGLFATADCLAKITQGEKVPVYQTRWKNEQLPLAPWAEWCESSGFDPSWASGVYFDQELFCIYEALAGKGAVFCSTLLVENFHRSGILRAYCSIRTPSELGYYLPGKAEAENLPKTIVLEWLQQLFDVDADES